MADPGPSSKACAAPGSETAPNDASQSKDAAAARESKKLPEWASFTGLIAAISIVAFTISRLYVVGIGFRLRQPIAIYFTPADYLALAFSWGCFYEPFHIKSFIPISKVLLVEITAVQNNR